MHEARCWLRHENPVSVEQTASKVVQTAAIFAVEQDSETKGLGVFRGTTLGMWPELPGELGQREKAGLAVKLPSSPSLPGCVALNGNFPLHLPPCDATPTKQQSRPS